jgi:hypothetical protein
VQILLEDPYQGAMGLQEGEPGGAPGRWGHGRTLEEVVATHNHLPYYPGTVPDTCTHLDTIATDSASGRGCVECLATGGDGHGPSPSHG